MAMIRLLLASLLLLPLSAQADEPVRSITVYGQAKNEVKPDAALLQVTIENKAATLQETKRLQDAEQAKLMDITQSLKLEADDVKTQSAQLQPDYVYNHKLKKQEFKGYAANTRLQIKIRALDQVGMLMDKLVKAGFERIDNVRYILDDDTSHRDAVLVKALANAKAKAAMLADELDADLGKAISVQEGAQSTPIQPRPMMRGMAMEVMAAAPMADMSVAPPSGLIQISGTVTALFEIK